MAGQHSELKGKATRQAATPAVGRSVATAIDRFGGELLSEVASLVEGNVVLSPYSVAVALAMTRVGAAGETRAQIDRSLHLGDLDADAGFNALDQALDARTRGVMLATANALWPQAGYPIAAPFLDRLASHYGAGLHPVDFQRNAESSRRTINEWVSDATVAKIPELLPLGSLHSLTRLVLTNAVYLKAAWAQPFDATATRIGRFIRLDGSAIDASFMHKSSHLAIARGAGWQMVELPYAGGTLAMDVVIPDAGRFAEVARALEDGIAPFAMHLTPAFVQLALPKFRCRTQTNLVDALSARGITDLFDADRADLSAMTTAEDLYVSDVVHETFIEVNEAGTEAAAATAVVVVARSAPIDAVPLTVDRPFIIALRAVETNALLFLGRILEPRT